MLRSWKMWSGCEAGWSLGFILEAAESPCKYMRKNDLVCFGIQENNFSVEDNLDSLELERRITVKL